MALAESRVLLVLATLLLSSACSAGHHADADGGAGTSVTAGAGGAPGSGGASGAADAGVAGGSSGGGAAPAADGGKAGASGSAGSVGAAGKGGTSAMGMGGTSATGGTAGAAGNAPAGSADCPTGLKGPALVNVPAPAGSAVSSYCVDATEVTNAQYAAFLDASVATTEQDTTCAWNTSYTPSRDWPATGKDDYPVVSVDWCDAYAYCKWGGKHLCGKIGGGANDFGNDFDDATKSEWFNACSAGGMSTYPYGDAYDAKACVGIDYDQAGFQPATDVARAVATAMCAGGYGGLHDLSGNVWEWENSCNGPASTDGCLMRGGAFNSDTKYLVCGSNYDRERNFSSASLGFRCCAARN
jgi:formylglycine-generating enzyme required for sulfatase activity